MKSFKQFLADESLRFRLKPGDLVNFVSSAASSVGVKPEQQFMILKTSTGGKVTMVDYPELETILTSKIEKLSATDLNALSNIKAKTFIQNWKNNA